jgi:hypothetical protein
MVDALLEEAVKVARAKAAHPAWAEARRVHRGVAAR